jgi:TolB-like protein/DNA-binding winged helix-turn-helix (wHTH) protein
MEPPPSEARVYSFGAFELDARLGELRKAGRKQKIAPQPLQVLQVLLEHPQDVVTREELRQRIWPEDIFVDYELALKKCINRIRQILGDSAESPRFIETVPRRGYRFIANVEQVDRAWTPAWAHEHPGAGSQAPEESVTSALAERPRGLAMRLTVLAAAVSCVMLAILVFVRLRPWEKFGAPSKAPSIRSLAVLPLENLSHDAEQEYFADGMTDALITDLAQIHALRVISRNSAMQYKSKHKSMPQIARELNVDAVVEGTVMRSGDRVRITAQLIEAPQDRHLWAETYEGDLRDILGLQDQVAKAIAAEIRVTLTPQEQVQLTNARRVDPQAEDAYLTGRYYWNRRATDAVRKSCDYFQEAIDKDPTYASAYAGLADCYNVLGYYRYQSPSETFARGKAAAQRALQIDESLAEAHASLAYDKLYYDFDWTGAERE